MKTQASRRGDSLCIYLSGELDEHSAPTARAEADAFIDENTGCSRAVFNLAGVRFMDSTGIGFLIGRYKKIARYGGKMCLENPNVSADKVLAVSGVYTLIPKI